MLVLGGLLALVAATTSRSDGRSGRVGGLTALLACTAVLVRWGAPSLSAAGGAQAVLGPAVAVGTTAAAASAVLAAAAIALLTPPRQQRRVWDLVITVCFGLVVGAVAAGPTFPNDLPVRVAGAVVGIALAVGASLLPRRRLVATGAFASGALALMLAAVA